MIDQESRFDGFRTMKTDLRARPVYLKRDDRIKAHFLTCFLTLLLYKYLEKKVNRYPKKILRLQIAITAICSLKICQIALNESVKDRNLIQCKLKCKTDKVWNEFETIQSDIFDHLIAMSLEFGLKMYQLSV